MKTKHGYAKLTMGYNTYFILEAELNAMLQPGIMISDIIAYSTLELDEGGRCVSSQFPNHIRSEAALAKDIIRWNKE